MENEGTQSQAQAIIMCGAFFAICLFLVLSKIGEPFGDRTIFGLLRSVRHSRKDYRDMLRKRRTFTEEERKWREKFQRKSEGKMKFIINFDQRMAPRKFRDRF